MDGGKLAAEEVNSGELTAELFASTVKTMMAAVMDNQPSVESAINGPEAKL